MHRHNTTVTVNICPRSPLRPLLINEGSQLIQHPSGLEGGWHLQRSMRKTASRTPISCVSEPWSGGPQPTVGLGIGSVQQLEPQLCTSTTAAGIGSARDPADPGSTGLISGAPHSCSSPTSWVPACRGDTGTDLCCVIPQLLQAPVPPVPAHPRLPCSLAL